MKCQGWIFDLYHKNGEIVVWIKQPDGRCVPLIDGWRPRIHVCGEFADLARLSCEPYAAGSRFVEKFEKPGDQSKSVVLEREVDNERKALAFARKVQKQGNYSKFRIYNVDIPAVQMYLYHKDLFPLAFVKAEECPRGVRWSLEDSRERVAYQIPPLRTVRLELNTSGEGRVQRFYDKIATIRIIHGTDCYTIDSGDEVDKLLELVTVFREEDPDIVLTINGDSFIFPFLARKAQEKGVLDKLVLGREASPLKVYEVQGHSYFSYGKILYRETAARLFGRLHIDESNAFISADCGLDGLFEVARTCIIPLQRASRATIGTSMTSLQFYNAVKRDILIPWNKNAPEELKNVEELVVADRGGFIHEPKVGVFDEVGELDFSSLYPTLMVKKNLSGETVNCQCCQDSTNRVPELRYNICQRWQGIVPRSLDILLRKRAVYKKLKKDSKGSLREIFNRRQDALKWILVCSFGYLGFKNARFGKIDAHIATCAFSRVALGELVAIAESNGFNLVHGIVDSVWLRKPKASSEEYVGLCEEVGEKLGLPISFEGCYKWVVFLNSKVDHRVPVLNRYYGVFEDGTLKVRGIELRRHDTPEVVMKCQAEVLAVLSKANDSREFKALIPQALRVIRSYVSLLKEGKVPARELVITKNLSKDPGNYSNLVPQAIAAQELVRAGGNVHGGQSIRYLLTRPERGEAATGAVPYELADGGVECDFDKYVDLVLASAENILLPFGYDSKTLQTILEGPLPEARM